jgi:hypothetical protein
MMRYEIRNRAREIDEAEKGDIDRVDAILRRFHNDVLDVAVKEAFKVSSNAAAYAIKQLKVEET